MEPPLDSSAEEIRQLCSRLDQLVDLTASPALPAGGRADVLVPLLDALLEWLRPSFVLVRLNDPDGENAIEVMRSCAPLQRTWHARQIGAALDSAFGQLPQAWPARARLQLGDLELAVASVRLGRRAEFGVIVAGSTRSEFPADTDRVLLDVSANQATLSLQQSRLLSVERQAAVELDERVARRERELAEVAQQLKNEVAARRRAEESLREGERESRLIANSIPGPLATLMPAGEIEFVNDALVEYCGQPLEALRQWGTNGTLHPEDLPRAIQVFGTAIAAGEPYDYEARIRRFDGAYRWHQVRGLPLRDTRGRIVRWYVLLLNVDKRVRAERAIVSSEHQLKLIIDTIPALAWSARPDGGAEYFNQHYLDFVALAPEQARDWGWTVAVHPDDLRGLAAAWQRIRTGGQPGEAEARLRRHDGVYRWFLMRASPLRDESGKIVQWYGVNTDVEDRRRAEAEVRRAYDHMTEAQRLSQTGSFTSDLQGDEQTWSDELYRICEFEPGSPARMQRLQDIVHPEDAALFQGSIERAIVGADARFEIRIVTPRGTTKHLLGAAHRVEQVTGPVLIGAIHDVTAGKVAEAALNSARFELAYVARVATLSTLAASIAHQVNQPLAGIIANASTCLRMLDADPPNVAGARKTARRSIRDGSRAAEVIAQLRSLFTKREFTLEPMDLNAATREVIALSKSEFQKNRVIVQPVFAEDLPPVVGDRAQLQQVLLTLFCNASEAMADVHDRPRQLVIRTEREDGDRVRVAVRDVGVGFDLQSADRLFDAFYSTKGSGLGIGLSVSRSIIERHRGRIWAEPNEGPGVTFWFSLPRAPQGVKSDP